MKKETLRMSRKERERLIVMGRIQAEELTKKEASEVLSLCYRQVLRINKRYKEEGAKGLVHRSRGKPSNRRKRKEFREAVIDRYRERYEDFGPTLASEKLEKDGYQINPLDDYG